MRLSPSDPDIATLFRRIENDEIDLQPDFQRGEVWSDFKRKRLIDSILRNWHIPPIHLILDDSSEKQSVLDGQQRLAAIRDFIKGELKIDGHLEPLDSHIQSLDGRTYLELPDEMRRRIDRFTIRVFLISDYSVSEPSELFYRLNQPASLTPAEQRNAFFGQTRVQVKKLVDLVRDSNVSTKLWSFSNARMAHDDVLARCLYLLERGTLRERVSAARLADRYRSGEPFSDEVFERLRDGVETLSRAADHLTVPFRQNKAAAQSWLLFACELRQVLGIGDDNLIGDFLPYFEIRRQEYQRRRRSADLPSNELDQSSDAFHLSTVGVFEDRSTSRVADVTSVVMRDMVLWINYCVFHLNQRRFLAFSSGAPYLHELTAEIVRSKSLGESELEELSARLNWGSSL